MLDHNDPETWLELPVERAAGAIIARTHQIADPIYDTGMTYAPCRCWRCRGGVALADRATLDRLLAKHLMTLSESERGQWMLLWAGHPRHDADARDQLNTWLRIMGGGNEPPPVYPVYAMPEEA
ncbi:hypothetical protein [Achromobacter denitrificans]|uniref:Uncharacterized protein n=1 Tax=Achromobacter denitrificans TaxID=32002 RepID=A0ABZ3G559_ACHDE|nr:hypothetical protein [Achromobacter denitrificans]QCS64408.1 hypothetical protein EC609_19115 [Achromobacter denitrificans]CAB3861093.1 hypothetical protein LMG1860_03335 [Achromobacter denitrificans]